MNDYWTLYSEFSHVYKDRDAAVFTFGVRAPLDLSEEFLNSLAADPVAAQPLTEKDFPRANRAPSQNVLAYRKRRNEAYQTETEFWRQELKTATAAKFLSVLRGEKVKSTADPPGTRKTTWIFVHYRNKTLNLGMFEWVVGDKQPYVRFRKATSRNGFYH